MASTINESFIQRLLSLSEGGIFILEVEYLQHSRRLEECKDEEARLKYKRQAGISNVFRQRVGIVW